MKVTVEIECTPTEARELLGLPDVSAFQNAMMEEVKNKISGGLKPGDVENYMNTMMTGAQTVQNQLWSFVSGVSAAGGAGSPDKSKK